MTALFESMRVRDGKVPLLDRHVARLARAASATGLAAPPSDADRQILNHAGASRDAALRADWDGASLAVVVRELPKSMPLALATVRDPHPGYPWKSVERRVFDR